MEKSDNSNLPNHIAIIMDGNRRWAKERNLPTKVGHNEGGNAIEKVAKYCSKIGIKNLTVFAFSTENWKRSKEEVDTLMGIFERYINDFDKKYNNENIAIRFIGDLSVLSEKIQEGAKKVTKNTEKNDGMVFNVALNYGGKEEILRAIKNIVNDKIEVDKINEEVFEKYLYTSVPVDLLIRTSGEMRISNFLPWQLSYAEMYFTKQYWPDFNEESIDLAIEEFAKRKRNFGGNRE